MPQEADLPLEESDVLTFTPDSLKDIPGAPSFLLRACTPRDRRYHQRRFFEQGINRHSLEDIREEILTGLKRLWSPEDHATYVPLVKSVWEARDDFNLQRQDQPEGEEPIVFDFDPDVCRAVDALVDKVAKEWERLRIMMADNMDFEDQMPLILTSVVVESWTGLDVARRLDRGYVDLASIENMKAALDRFEKKNAKLYKLKPGTAWMELFARCATRMALDQEEAGNSESPSPSEPSPPPSSETTTSAKAGKSQASARSSKIPAAA